MGIESDKVVYEYLSRVGDVAQQRQLPSATRMRLVSQLRDEIDRRRARAVVDSPAAVRRILARIGSPDEVVDAAGDGASGGAVQPPAAAVPAQPERRETRQAGQAREKEPQRRSRGLRRVVPRPRPAEPQAPPRADAPAPPHRAGEHELGDAATQPDWWRVDSSPFGVGDSVPGFVGGVEIPELLKPPEEQKDTPPAPAAVQAARAEPDIAAEPDADPAAARRRLLSPPGTWNNPLLLLAAALLVAGAVLGNLLPLAVGWLIAYASRRLTRWEMKWAVMILPGAAVAAGFVWLWGRLDGRWGAPVAEGHMNDALAETWPWVVRGAAVASALFLVWRSQRKG
ncbi:hypothetical protein [Streptomyces chromofuscus]|uniref:Uncharacterized protein n=1 Tax=Streptomyces chromofuscus TaxID=42881 RepID=A0A7M2TFQ5_STRCW|nr:hypothetical protein [Streptomyces chromofuscus]QOV47312.1 hypothetical protein IPT68_16405 [Streptomyces chromofuscus]GGT25006.1 membrane protein [Streptomyces chromofuscus]